MRVRSISIAFVTLGLVSACHSPSAPTGPQRIALNQHEAQWNAHGLHRYAYDLHMSTSWFDYSLRVYVQGDTVAGVTWYSQPMPASVASTIPQLFASIRAALAQGRAVTVSYDPRYGYPTSIDAPDPPGTADTAWRATITAFDPSGTADPAA